MSAPLRLVGVGIGPFNLGLAALAEPLPEVEVVLLDARPRFGWHAGLLLSDAAVQVPFLADLVTLADPTSRHSALNYLHEHDRLYRFYFLEQMHMLRREFDAYCRWVAERLGCCRFSRRVESVAPAPAGGWTVRAVGADGAVEEHAADAVAIGVGDVPSLPAGIAADPQRGVIHSSTYLDHRERLLGAGRVCVVGSGQSAAEVVADLLDHAGAGQRRTWFTRGDGFLPMECSKLGLEHFSPEYAAHFHGLPAQRRDDLRAGQDLLYKGISAETSARIYDALYRASVDGGDPGLQYRARCEALAARPTADGVTLSLRHRDEGAEFSHRCDALVLATGYAPAPWPMPDRDALVELDARGRPVIERDYRVRLRGGGRSTLFAQNAEIHAHGVGAPDLGLGAHRNAVILNALCGHEVYRVRQANVFQSFGAPRP